jgi:hypothetical protein
MAGEFRQMTNCRLYTSKPNTVTITKVRRTETGDHLVRKAKDRTVQKVFLGKPDGRRKAGRPELRWLYCIENDLKCMDVKRWRKKPEGRSVWAIILNDTLIKLY